MRNLIVSNIMSIDGYFEGPGRDVMALPMDGFFDEHNLERQAGQGHPDVRQPVHLSSPKGPGIQVLELGNRLAAPRPWNDQPPGVSGGGRPAGR